MKLHLAFVFVLATCALPARTQEQNRERVGEVLGKPIFRDQLEGTTDEELTSSLQSLFLAPVFQHYWAAHPDVAPTEEELAAAERYFRQEHERRVGEEASELRKDLAAVEAKLSSADLDPAERSALLRRKELLETQLRPPGRLFAQFVLRHWKEQRHLYDTYGGGRVLWQQRGIEAFDATRRCLEDLEKRGIFRISEAHLRKLIYSYWTTANHGSFLTDDRERIRKEFLEPPWVKTATSQPQSRPSSAPPAKHGT